MSYPLDAAISGSSKEEPAYRMIDHTGAVVRRPIFSLWCGSPHGLACARRGKKWGFKDWRGRFVIQPRFDWADEFSEGLAAVRVRGAVGYIDMAGKFAIPPRFAWAGRFSNGLARVQVNNTCGFIDRRGRIVIKPKYFWARQFSEGLAFVQIGGRRKKYRFVGGRQGFINDKGTMVVVLKRHVTNSYYGFSEGLAPVQVRERDGFRHGYVDRRGQFPIPPVFGWAYRFTEGLAAVKVGEAIREACVEPPGLWGFIDKDGEFVIRPKFVKAYPFSEGLAPVWTGKGFGYIDRRGETVIRPKFAFAFGFSSGVAVVEFPAKVKTDRTRANPRTRECVAQPPPAV